MQRKPGVCFIHRFFDSSLFISMSVVWTLKFNKANGGKKGFVNEQFLVLENQQMNFLGYMILDVTKYIYMYIYLDIV